MTKRCIIIGASHSAAQLTASLRQEGWQGEILMIGDEAYMPYHRPPLSKNFLAGDKSVEDLAIRPPAFYDKKNVTFYQGRVVAIDRMEHRITLEDGRVFDYDKLALCLGARVRTLDVPGCDLQGIHYLRNISDVQGIQADLGLVSHGKSRAKSRPARTAVIIGGGYIGLETAASLKQQGLSVVVLEMADRVLQRVTAPEVSAFYERIHTEAGVDIQTNKHVAGFVSSDVGVQGLDVQGLQGLEIQGSQEPGRVTKVICSDGSEYPADLVVVGVGIIPNTELAEDAGLLVDNGIWVDEFSATSDPDIVAAGDCTNQFNPLFQRRIRLESVPNANEQAKCAAAAICGTSKAYQNLPWFWSDQYDLKLQIAGLNEGYDRLVLRGDYRSGRSFAAFYFKGQRMIAADCVNSPQEFMISKRIISSGVTVDPFRLVDESIPAKQLL